MCPRCLVQRVPKKLRYDPCDAEIDYSCIRCFYVHCFVESPKGNYIYKDKNMLYNFKLFLFLILLYF